MTAGRGPGGGNIEGVENRQPTDTGEDGIENQEEQGSWGGLDRTGLWLKHLGLASNAARANMII
jgi:hypothetical protein